MANLGPRLIDTLTMITSIVIMRTIIDIPDNQLSKLNDLCEREKISRAEAIRRALNIMLAEKQTRDREATFGTWARRDDSRAEIATLREEWSR